MLEEVLKFRIDCWASSLGPLIYPHFCRCLKISQTNNIPVLRKVTSLTLSVTGDSVH